MRNHATTFQGTTRYRSGRHATTHHIPPEYRSCTHWENTIFMQDYQDGCGPKAPVAAPREATCSDSTSISDRDVLRSRIAGTIGTHTNSSGACGRTRPSGEVLRSVHESWKAFIFVRGCRRLSRYLADAKLVVFVTTILTIYVLVADDVRLRSFDKQDDEVFAIVTIACIVVFGLEIIICSFGKADYFLGFFFYLDVVATATLVLDIPSVGEEIGGTSDEGLEKTKGGRTARIAARASRMVRMLRLVRIVKLYKVAYESRVMKPSAGRAGVLLGPGERPDWEKDWNTSSEAVTDDEKVEVSESRLGKHLSDLTVQRVIILVITMLILLPLLMVNEELLLPRSASYGADEVWYSWLASEDEYDDNSTGITERCRILGLDQVACPNDSGKARYERNMLRYIFYHNWFARNDGAGDCREACPAAFSGHVFWIGMGSEDRDVAEEFAGKAKLSRESVEMWVQNQATVSNNRYYYRDMPEEVNEILAGEWSIECKVQQTTMFGISLLADSLNGQIENIIRCPEDLRQAEKRRFLPGVLTDAESDHLHLEFWYDLRPHVREEALMRLILTGVIIVLLGVSVLCLNQDVNELVVLPVEGMISKVAAIRNNPLAAVKLAEDDFWDEEKKKTMKAEEKAIRQDMEAHYTPYRHLLVLVKFLSCRQFKKRKQPMETVLLEKTIVKLGSLLALGFGEAGANIINHNMVATGLETTAVNAMIAGSRVECIIGHTRIRNFATATEALQARVITFVNQVAEIVHGVVTSLHGAPNKNNGETFLLIWRTTDKDSEHVTQLADMSVLAMAKCVGAVHGSETLAKYRSHPGLQQRLGSSYRVDITCGIHYGWAIEGAVGSEFKIDASYLSPNVSCTVNIESAAEVYQVNCIASDLVVQLCTEGMKEKCRLVDRVRISGASKPMDLYTLDLDTRRVVVERRMYVNDWTPRRRFQVRRKMEGEKLGKWRKNITGLFEGDPVVSAMRETYTDEFKSVFNMGYQNYFCGQWFVARDMLTHTSMMLGYEDGPSVAILNYMASYGYEAPHGWEGIRELGRAEAVGSSRIKKLELDECMISKGSKWSSSSASPSGTATGDGTADEQMPDSPYSVVK